MLKRNESWLGAGLEKSAETRRTYVDASGGRGSSLAKRTRDVLTLQHAPS
jgi:hypothetical protein